MSRNHHHHHQTRTGSLVEALCGVGIGFAINFTANLLILPHFGFSSLTAHKAFWIGVVFTGISIARTYVVRRVFNRVKAFNSSSTAERQVGGG